MSAGQRRILAVDLMKDALGPLIRFVKLKTKMLAQRSTLMDQRSELMDRM